MKTKAEIIQGDFIPDECSYSFYDLNILDHSNNHILDHSNNFYLNHIHNLHENMAAVSGCFVCVCV